MIVIYCPGADWGDDMDRLRFQVDFNELLEHSLVCLSAHDVKVTEGGEPTLLYEGMLIEVYDDDVDDDGNPDNLVALGVVERNKSTGHHLSHVKWCCRVDRNGIQHESDRKVVD
jgi:hypothetical protein